MEVNPKKTFYPKNLESSPEFVTSKMQGSSQGFKLARIIHSRSTERKREYPKNKYTNKKAKQRQKNNSQQAKPFMPKTNDMTNSPFLVPMLLTKDHRRSLPKFIDSAFQQRMLVQKQKALLAEIDPILTKNSSPEQLPKLEIIRLGGGGNSVKLPKIQSASQGQKRRRILTMGPDTTQKKFFVNAGYNDFKKALLKRGWLEVKDRCDHNLDLKFTLCNSEINHQLLQHNTLINHCRGEGSMTCKTLLIETLNDGYKFRTSWLANVDTGIADIQIKQYSQGGIDSFFPKQFILTNQEDLPVFQEEMQFMACESHLKQYISAFEKDFTTFTNSEGLFCREKLTIYVNIVLRKIAQKQVDNVLDKEKVVHGPFLTKQEQACIVRDNYPESYIKYLYKEDWFFDMQRTVAKHFCKNKALKTKGERQHSLWQNIYTLIKKVLADLQEFYPQTMINGIHNQWIVKPGGLSRGRKIKIFDNYNEICHYAELDITQKVTQKTWVVQKYIEKPLLIKHRKFDIRVWVIVKSWNPLKVHFYKPCYMRFSSQDYDPHNKNNLFSHLTNNSITAKQIKIGVDKNFDKIHQNMWNLDQLKEHLNNKNKGMTESPKKESPGKIILQPEAPPILTESNNETQERQNTPTTKEETDYDDPDIWDTTILPQLRDIIRIIFLSAWGYVEWKDNSIGIYGLDLMLDQDLRMWLIEVNKSPCMAYSTDITSKLIPKFMEDMAKVIIDKETETDDLELVLSQPYVKEPQEIRQNTEFTIIGDKIGCRREKRKHK